MGVIPALAFTDVGLDFTGPIYLKNEETGRMRKLYICIFTCTHSRMVHFELVNNMTTEEFLAALRRMINRRGWCKKIISNNQLTFKKAEKVVQLSIFEYLGRELNDKTVQNYLGDFFYFLFILFILLRGRTSYIIVIHRTLVRTALRGRTSLSEVRTEAHFTSA